MHDLLFVAKFIVVSWIRLNNECCHKTVTLSFITPVWHLLCIRHLRLWWPDTRLTTNTDHLHTASCHMVISVTFVIHDSWHLEIHFQLKVVWVTINNDCSYVLVAYSVRQNPSPVSLYPSAFILHLFSLFYQNFNQLFSTLNHNFTTFLLTKLLDKLGNLIQTLVRWDDWQIVSDNQQLYAGCQELTATCWQLLTASTPSPHTPQPLMGGHCPDNIIIIFNWDGQQIILIESQ